MLATLVKEPFQDSNYVYEVKWDGYRIIAFCSGEKVKLQSRGGQDFSSKYPAIVKALRDLSLDCIIDGEMVYIDDDGKPNFDLLQVVNGQAAPILYYAFDVLWKDGEDLTDLPLLNRKAVLEKMLPAKNARIKYSDHFDDGIVLFDQMKKLGLEGIIAKRRDSQYHEDERSKKWLKVVIEKREEFVIGGWVDSTKRNTFRTLLFGSYQGEKLIWIGHAGGGFKDKEMPGILKRLKQLEVDQSPFVNEVEYSEGKPHWVRPELVANIKFATLTKSGRIRKPAIFVGFREDKRPEQVVLEQPQMPPKESISPRKLEKSSKPFKMFERGPKDHPHGHLPASPESNWPSVEKEKIITREEIKVGDCSVTIYNENRELWKEVTKGHLIQYYINVQNYILPHLKDRPLTLHVKLNGPTAPGVYIKDMENRNPRCSTIIQVPRKHRRAGMRDIIEYLVCNNLTTLIYMINLGCIDINPWTATVHRPEYPDFIVIDLDPSDDDFQKAIEAARAAKSLLNKRKITSFIKTSGKTGLHIFLPCSGFNNTQARKIAKHICDEIHYQTEDFTTTEVSKHLRGTKLYLDLNQNDYADTVASAYSVRPYKTPNVSMPLKWTEVKSSLKPEMFSIHNVPRELAKRGDVWNKIFDSKNAHAGTSGLLSML